METTNAVKLAAILVSYKKKIGGEMTAEGFRNAMGSGGSARSFGFIDYDYKGVSIRPEGEPETKYTWSKFIKFCRENGLIKEESIKCNTKLAQKPAAAANMATPAAPPQAKTSTISVSAADAAASIHKLSSESTQASPSAPCSPVDCGTAAPLACAGSASATATAGFDYSGLDLPTVDTLHLAERMISDARRDYVTKLAQAVYIAHDALCGGVVHNVDNSKHGNRGDETFRLWCESVGMCLPCPGRAARRRHCRDTATAASGT